jgi:hypothetical protein
MRNRRECIRCALLGITLEPSLHAETVDVSETGLAWRSPHALVPGDVVTIEAPAFFEALGLPARRVQMQVRDLHYLGDAQYRVGARFIAPPDTFVMALRRAVLRLQRQGQELKDHVVDVLVMPHL